MPTVFLGLGSNQGVRLGHLQRAVDRLQAHAEIEARAVSPVYETEAHTLDAEATQPPFLNAVLQVATTRAPEAVLRAGQEAESAAGRLPEAQRATWAPRPLDVDVLAYGGHSQRTDALVLPHPRLGERAFVLRPWADLAPNFVVPAPFDAPVHALLNRCPDAGAIVRTPYALTASPDALP